MEGFFQTAMSNALLVTAAAPVVWAIAKLSGKPALTHALWLVILLKLIVPPIWLIPFHLPQARQVEIERVHEPDAPAMISSGTAVERMPELANVPDQHEIFPVIHPSPALQSATTPAVRSFDISRISETTVESLWIGGSLLCLIIAVVRMRRFSRSLRFATLAPAPIQLRIDQLAERLNLSRAPRVWFIPGMLCPMLWAVGGSARVLIPQTLWDRLDNPQRDAILIHELAHWRRRDHWVRWIELLATSLYWWHPVCWWACHELREAEEQCCDAWVLSTTGDFRHYANALLEAVEFVSSWGERPFASSAVPALASGLGQFGRLKRRIMMLKNGNISRTLSRYGIAATFTTASLLLPLSPILAQEAPKPAAVPVASGTSDVGTIAVVEDPSADIVSDEASQLRDARREIAELSKKLDEAQARIKVLQQGTSNGRNNWAPVPVGGARESAPEAAPATNHRSQSTSGDDYRPGSAGSYVRAGGPAPAGNYIGTASTDRLDKIEAELHSLLHEVESLRGRGNGVPATPENSQPGLERK
jgi:bla regulator protein BlaR1